MQPLNSHTGIVKKAPPAVRKAIERVESAASELTPAEIFEKGEFLGAGLMGGAYRVEHGGQSFVAKQLGHEQSVTGMLDTHTQKQLQIKAQKQVAVQNALAMSGLPVPASALLGEDKTWVVMEEAKGLSLEDLSPQEKVQGTNRFEEMKETARPTVEGVIADLRKQHPDHQDCFGDHLEGGATFARSDQGIIVNGFFDPVV